MKFWKLTVGPAIIYRNLDNSMKFRKSTVSLVPDKGGEASPTVLLSPKSTVMRRRPLRGAEGAKLPSGYCAFVASLVEGTFCDFTGARSLQGEAPNVAFLPDVAEHRVRQRRKLWPGREILYTATPWKWTLRLQMSKESVGDSLYAPPPSIILLLLLWLVFHYYHYHYHY